MSDVQGDPLNGSFDMRFRILDAGSVQQWASGTITVGLTNGAYSVVLGESPQPPLPAGLFDNNDILQLEISFNDGTHGMEALSPTVQILPVPYALRAAHADDVDLDILTLPDPLINGSESVLKTDLGVFSIGVTTPPNVNNLRIDPSLGSLQFDGIAVFDDGVVIPNPPANDFTFRWENDFAHIGIGPGTTLAPVLTLMPFTGLTPGYTPLAGDWNADGTPDVSFDRPGAAENWLVLRSSDYALSAGLNTTGGHLQTEHLSSGSKSDFKLMPGVPGPSWHPVQGDYDGDGLADLDLWRPTGGHWLVLRSEDFHLSSGVDPLGGHIQVEDVAVGNKLDFILEPGTPAPNWMPLRADFDGDGVLDLVVSRPSNPEYAFEIRGLDYRISNGLDAGGTFVKALRPSNGSSITLRLDPSPGTGTLRAGNSGSGGEDAIAFILDPHDVVTFEALVDRDDDEVRLKAFSALNSTQLRLQPLTNTLVCEADFVLDGKHSIHSGGQTMTYEWDFGEFKSTVTDGVNPPVVTVVKPFSGTTMFTDQTIAASALSLDDVRIVPDGSTAQWTLELPPDEGLAGQALVNQGNGNTAWEFVVQGQYLLRDGSLPMTGDLDLGGNGLLNASDGSFSGTLSVQGAVFTPGAVTFSGQPVDFEGTEAQWITTSLLADAPAMRITDGTDLFVVEKEGDLSASSITVTGGGSLTVSGNGTFDSNLEVKSSLTVSQGGSGTSYSTNSMSAGGLVETVIDSGDSVVTITTPGSGTEVTTGLRSRAFESVGEMSVDCSHSDGARQTILSVSDIASGNSCQLVFDPNTNTIQSSAVINKPGGTFKIDHPLDPYNKYLYHSFVESPDMMNIYNGNTLTDDTGVAVVVMPDYFEALNRDFRYQLTVIGEFAQAIVGKEMEDGRFTIITDKPNVKVSWQVTGVRHDLFANENRVVVEVDKESGKRGTLLYEPRDMVRR
jgi:hypothetical protein